MRRKDSHLNRGFRVGTVGRAVALCLLAAIAVSGLILAWLYRDQIAHSKTVLLPLVTKAKGTPLTTAVVFFLADVMVTALSVPIEILFAVTAGALFGLIEGTVLTGLAASIGATVSFLASRYLLRDWVRNRFAHRLEAIDRGLAEDGAYYLLSLRLLPVVPFSLVNILMGVTDFKTSRFYLFSLLGMVPAVALYVNAGTQFSKLSNLSGVLSPPMLISLALLGLFPLMAKWLVPIVRKSLGTDSRRYE